MKDSIFSTLRQIRLLFGSLSLRDLLVNRLVLVIVVTLVVTGSVQVFASANNDGHFSGQVTNAAGEPVADATVVIQGLNIRSQTGRENTTTDENVYYEFPNQTDLLEFRIIVTKEGYESTVIRYHLYFKGQNDQIDVTLHKSE